MDSAQPAEAANPSLGDRLEAVALRRGIQVARTLGPVAASNLGGRLVRTVGPWLPVSRVAEANLRRALPELDSRARHRVLSDIWENLGRTMAELPHVGALQRTADGPGWECQDDTALRALGDRGGPAILFSGHLANWEIGLAVAAGLGLTVSWFDRAASNKLADVVIQDMRRDAMGAAVPMFAKGRAGARDALAHLRRGGLLGMLVDQKLDDGIAVPFFGCPAMTTPALAQFALRFRCPVIPIHPVRLGPARFRVICEPPLALPDTGDQTADVYALTLAVNATLERWIREQPGCWLWMHRRWPKDPSWARHNPGQATEGERRTHTLQYRR
jgi:KDO2-lipid IV(A) lauroyltransferase